MTLTLTYFEDISGSELSELAVGDNPSPKGTRILCITISRPTGPSQCPPLSCDGDGGNAVQVQCLLHTLELGHDH